MSQVHRGLANPLSGPEGIWVFVEDYVIQERKQQLSYSLDNNITTLPKITKLIQYSLFDRDKIVPEVTYNSHDDPKTGDSFIQRD